MACLLWRRTTKARVICQFSRAALVLPCSLPFCRRFSMRLQTPRQGSSLPHRLFALPEGAGQVRPFPSRPCAGTSIVA